MGGQGRDTIDGGSGSDIITGGEGADTIAAGSGRDWINFDFELIGVTVNLSSGTGEGGTAAGDSYSGIENVSGSFAADLLIGNRSANELYGNDGNDTLRGGAGNDTLTGGLGEDTYTGGTGADKFQLELDATDRFTDFVSAVDKFIVNALGFGGGLASGGNLGGKFQSNTTGLAEDANDRFIFNTAANRLYFDIDGTGSAEGLLIATFGTMAEPIRGTDFLLI